MKEYVREGIQRSKGFDEKANLSIIIVNYNGMGFSKDCLESLMASGACEEELIIVDNASTDGSNEYIRKEFFHVRIIELDKNYGFAMANNIGAKNAKGEYLIFLNNDAVVTPNWLNPLVDTMEKDSDIGIVGSKILLLEALGKINSAGANITFNGCGYDIGFLDHDSEKYNVGGYRGCVCAAVMMVRREEFLNFGGFDEEYFMYLEEDVDLCWRYWLYGKKVVCVHASIIYHEFGGTSGTYRHARA